MKEYLRGGKFDVFRKPLCKIGVVARIGTWEVISCIDNSRNSQEQAV